MREIVQYLSVLVYVHSIFFILEMDNSIYCHTNMLTFYNNVYNICKNIYSIRVSFSDLSNCSLKLGLSTLSSSGGTVPSF